VVPLLIGQLGGVFGLRMGMVFLYITIGYLFSMGIWAKPIISNATITDKIKELFRKKKAIRL
jgi:FHS family L-fucose permease-like MFS transporter